MGYLRCDSEKVEVGSLRGLLKPYESENERGGQSGIELSVMLVVARPLP